MKPNPPTIATVMANGEVEVGGREHVNREDDDEQHGVGGDRYVGRGKAEALPASETIKLLNWSIESANESKGSDSFGRCMAVFTSFGPMAMSAAQSGDPIDQHKKLKNDCVNNPLNETKRNKSADHTKKVELTWNVANQMSKTGTAFFEGLVHKTIEYIDFPAF